MTFATSHDIGGTITTIKQWYYSDTTAMYNKGKNNTTKATTTAQSRPVSGVGVAPSCKSLDAYQHQHGYDVRAINVSMGLVLAIIPILPILLWHQPPDSMGRLLTSNLLCLIGVAILSMSAMSNPLHPASVILWTVMLILLTARLPQHTINNTAFTTQQWHQ